MSHHHRGGQNWRAVATGAKTAETQTARVAGYRYKVVKNGVTLGGHSLRSSAEKLAVQMGAEVIDTRPPKKKAP